MESFMDQQEIKDLLTKNNLSSYIDLFEKNHLLDSEVLKTVTDADYQSIGVSILGDRKKLLSLFANDSNETKTESKSEPQEEKKEEDELISTKRNGKTFLFRTSDPSKLYCPKCKAQVSEDSTLCGFCNHSFAGYTSSSSSSSSSYNSSSSSSSNTYSQNYNSYEA